MTDTELLAAFRSIVREELDRRPEPSAMPGDAGAFVAGLWTGEKVQAAELHRRYREWGGTLTVAALGRALARCPRMRRSVARGGRRFYEVLG